MYVRKEVTSIGADPTTSVTFTRKTKRLTIYLQEFFGDITCRIYWRGHSILFTSCVIHPLLNKIATKKFNALEDAYQIEYFSGATLDHDTRYKEDYE